MLSPVYVMFEAHGHRFKVLGHWIVELIMLK